jgi:predicted TIM-barrel fold metal-dependent hydrolase
LTADIQHNEAPAVTIKIIDPHIHLFDLENGQYTWLKTLSSADHVLVAKTFRPGDLTLTGDLSLAGYVHIEAGFDNQMPWLEIANVEKRLMQQTSTPLVAVKTSGSADLRADTALFKQQVDNQRQFVSCVGMRHILDEQALDILRHKNTLDNLHYLSQCDILFELQVSLSDSKAVLRLIDIMLQLPKLRLVLNHAGLPKIQSTQAAPKSSTALLQSWQTNARKLSALPNVWVKCSGWEMVQRDYVENDLVFYLKHLAECFGPARIMFASNFPLVLYCKGYQQYWCMMLSLAKRCSLDIHQVCFENAKRVYQF